MYDWSPGVNAGQLLDPVDLAQLQASTRPTRGSFRLLWRFKEAFQGALILFGLYIYCTYG